MNTLTRAQKKWKCAAARHASAIARKQYDRFWSLTLTGSILLVLLVSLTSHYERY